MADNPNFADTSGQDEARSQSSNSSGMDSRILDSLAKLNQSIDSLRSSIDHMSQSNMKDDMYDSKSKFRQAYKNRESRDRSRKTATAVRSGKSAQSFGDAFSDALFEGLVSSEFKSEVRKHFQYLASGIGVDLQNASGSFGKQLGDYAANAIKNSKIGSAIQSRLQNAVLNTFSRFNAGFVRGVNRYDTRHNTDYASQFARNASTAQQPSDTSERSSRSVTPQVDIEPNSEFDLDDIVIYAKVVNLAADEVIQKYQQTAERVQEASTFAPTPPEPVPQESPQIPSAEIRETISNAVDASTSSAIPAAINEVSSMAVSQVAAGVGQAATSQAAAGVGQAAQAATSQAANVLSGGAVASGVVNGLLSTGPQIALLLAFDKLSGAIGPVIQELGKFIQSLKVTSQRYEESRKKNLEAAQRRLEADVKTIVTKPFEILEEAAKKIYDTWDNSLRLITATQGYSKADVQDLMAQYANRLRSQGLTDVIPGTDIINNLSKVIQAGLSGAVAEEFAYQATLLEAAVPTQDFFSYAADYASIAANAIRMGKSQDAAMAEATEQLTVYASNILAASRATGGFTTGLTNAQDLFNKAVKISQAAKTGDASEIGSVLTSVAATVGSIAPDLATSITDAIYAAAVGGNDSSTVALRSLAGVNASNTEFLQALARDPQKIFATLFENLAAMYQDSSDAYMEKAEGYAELFGLSAEAFQRIDFNYLAKSIAQMNSENSALSENLSLLQSGQTTLTAEQLKSRQINKYMIEEGLAYVLDNEAGRAIQQHMWDEQIARELQETTYGIELKGHSLELLEGIKSAVKKVIGLFNPFAWGKSAGNVLTSQMEAKMLEADIQQILQKGKVGSGNAQEFTQLITRDANLNVATPLADMLGGVSQYGIAHKQTEAMFALSGQSSIADALSAQTSQLTNLVQAFQTNVRSAIANTPTSKYSWGAVSKSSSAAQMSQSAGTATQPKLTTESSTDKTQKNLVGLFEKLLSPEHLSKFINQENPKTYEDWVASAKSFGIADFGKAVQDAGYTEAQLEDYFESKEVESGQKELKRQQQKEEAFWDAAINFYGTYFPNDYATPLLDLVTSIDSTLETFYEEFKSVYEVDLFKKLDAMHTANTGFYTHFKSTYQVDLFKKLDAMHTANTDFYTYFKSTYQVDLFKKLDAANKNMSNFYDVEFPTNFRAKLFEKLENWKTDLPKTLKSNIADPIVDALSGVTTSIGKLSDNQNSWVSKWSEFLTKDKGWNTYYSNIHEFTKQYSDYFLKHKTYNEAISKSGGYSKVEKVQRKERNQSGDAVYALADVLTKNSTDLKDPVVQTNALLAQILQVLTTIMNQNNESGGGVALADSLAALALGVTKKSKS